MDRAAAADHRPCAGSEVLKHRAAARGLNAATIWVAKGEDMLKFTIRLLPALLATVAAVPVQAETASPALTKADYDKTQK